MTCRACGGNLRSNFAVREMMYGTGEVFKYTQCASCRSLWLVDPPEDLAPYYSQDYYSLAQDRHKSNHWDYYRWLKNRGYYATRKMPIPWPERLSRPTFSTYGDPAGLNPQSRVLDVGCGAGDLLKEMKRCGFSRLVGVDPFIEADFSDEKLRLIKGDLDDVAGEFDVVMMHHSLEHLPRPAEALARVRDLLSPSGRVVVRIPLVADAWDIYGVDWVQLDAPRHMVLFSVPGFAQLAAQTGLRIVHQYCDSSSFQFWGSELYRLEIPLRDPRAQPQGPGPGPSLFSPAQMDKWATDAVRLNIEMRGDQGVFVLAPL